MNEGNYPRETEGLVQRGPSQDLQRPMQDLGRTDSHIGGQSEMAPPSQFPSKPREIFIQPKDHGFIVTVGCQSFAIEKISTLIRNLEKYLERPSETEQKWLSGKMDL